MADANVMTALIGAGSAIIAALITFAGVQVGAKNKLKELELTYQQRMADNRRSRARDYLESVYLPLQIALTRLLDAYGQYEVTPVDEKSQRGQEGTETFIRACEEFLQHSTELRRSGADAFLLTALDTQLQSFSSFLRASQSAKDVKTRVTFSFGTVGAVLGISRPIGLSTQLRGKSGRLLPTERLSINTGWLLWPRIGVSFDETVAAPISSIEFKERLQRSVELMRTYIKEVSLDTGVSE